MLNLDLDIIGGFYIRNDIPNLHFGELIHFNVAVLIDLINKTLINNNLLNSPLKIYNCDETFLPLDNTREKAVTAKGAKNVYCQALGTSELSCAVLLQSEFLTL